MGDWPGDIRQWGGQTQTITPHDPWSLGYMISQASTTSPASQTWQATNRALFVPFRLPLQKTVFRIMVGCGATAGNFDAGIYDEWGNLIVSTGSTAKATSSEVIVNIADTPIGPGLFYMALATNGVTAMIGQVGSILSFTQALGIRMMESAFPLPDPVTFAVTTGTLIPSMSLYLRA
jgi:hypothetical protein